MEDRHQIEREYWNLHAEALWKKGTRSIKDNWQKRRQIVKRMLDYDFTGKNVLEIGCGFAFTANTLSDLFGDSFEYVGVDISPTFLEAAEGIFGLTVKEASTTSLPFDNNTFDVCFALDVLEHIHPEDQEKTTLELNRVLKEEALIFINNPHPDNPCGHTPPFEHGFSCWDMVGLAESLGMEIERIDTYQIEFGEPNNHKYQFIVMRR